MPIPEVTALYAGVLGLMGFVLGATAGIYRGKHGIAVGDGGDPVLLLRMRRHANFVENVPLALILIAFLEMQSVTPTTIHIFGGALVFGRVLHWIGFDENVGNPLRGLGAGITALTMIVASVWNIVSFF